MGQFRALGVRKGMISERGRSSASVGVMPPKPNNWFSVDRFDPPNKALHRKAIRLRSIAAGELRR